MWYLSLKTDNFGEQELFVDAVKTISSRLRKNEYPNRFFNYFYLISYF